MLGKLMKYEIKATSRTFLPLYFVLLVSALINRLLGPLTQDSIRIPNIISMSLYVIILIGMFVMTFIVMISRFYKNLLSDEGYLMFTLPVKTWQHISGKLIISVIWITISFIMAIASIFIIATREVTLSDISMSIKILWELITEIGTINLDCYNSDYPCSRIYHDFKCAYDICFNSSGTSGHQT